MREYPKPIQVRMSLKTAAFIYAPHRAPDELFGFTFPYFMIERSAAARAVELLKNGPPPENDAALSYWHEVGEGLRPWQYPKGYDVTGFLLQKATTLATPALQRDGCRAVWTAAAYHCATVMRQLPNHWCGHDVHFIEVAQRLLDLGLTNSLGTPWHHASTPHPAAHDLLDRWPVPTRLSDLDELGLAQSRMFRADYELVQIIVEGSS